MEKEEFALGNKLHLYQNANNVCFNTFVTYFRKCMLFFVCVFSEGHGKLSIFSMKSMLATMCGGKIVDKLRCKYIFMNLAQGRGYS